MLFKVKLCHVYILDLGFVFFKYSKSGVFFTIFQNYLDLHVNMSNKDGIKESTFLKVYIGFYYKRYKSL